MEHVCTYVGFFVVEGGSKGECLRDGCLEIEVLFAWYASLGGVACLWFGERMSLKLMFQGRL